MARNQLTERRLIEQIELATQATGSLTAKDQAPMYLVAGLVGALRGQFPDAAKALARGAGMHHLADKIEEGA